ncbi:MAG: membrane protein insertase YidC [Elusimicrobiaceae bacterium]|nr:membrane protein insertase YidC [Elusimicrobiaceae bacterium]
MDRKFLLAAVFFMLLFTGYNQFVVVPRVQAEQKAAEEALAKTQQELAMAESSASVVKTQKTALPEELITFQSPVAQITFTSKGAGIKEYLFKDVLGDVNLTPYKGEGYLTTLPQVDFRETKRTKDTITFAGDLAGGVVMEKTYTFAENGINHVNITFANKTNKDITLPAFSFNFGPGLSTVKSELKDNARESKAVYLMQEEGKKHPTLVKFTSKDKSPVSSKEWIWAGVQNRYFLSVLIPQNWTAATLQTKSEVVDTQERFWGLFGTSEVKGPQLSINVPSQTLAGKTNIALNSDFYFGPKDYQAFEHLPYHFSRSIEFGFFGTLGRLARNVLETFYGWTGNYGVAIIMLTVLLQTLLFKFTLMSLKSSVKMKRVQPEMKRLQEKYKANPEVLNREMMALYQKHGINPLAGCLPMLIQLPIFLALFNALRTSWSLHGAGFVGWITDLSAKDPYYILPILMGAVMFFQQRSTVPSGMDPAQAAMFKYMPLIFTLLFMNFPSGLVLYWLTNSLITFGIQTMVNKKLAQAK